jgi:hypothetical protein
MGHDAEWESEAENWVRWVRTPGHDAYWYFRDSFFAAWRRDASPTANGLLGSCFYPGELIASENAAR